MDYSVCIPSGTISITAVVKNRPLNSRWHDPLYPASFTPFYLYGTPSEPHVDHVLLRAPNTQIASDLITLKLEPALTAVQLARARMWTAPRPRCSHSLPHTRPSVHGACFSVAIFEDAREAGAQGTGPLEGGSQIAKGMLELGKMVYVDCEKLNEDPEYVGLGVQSANGFIGNMRQATRVQWAEVTEKALGHVQGGGQDA
jgi:hypothetical protein